MANTNFATINAGVSSRSRFNMSNTHSTTLNFGQLIPIFTQEMVPGDHINLDNKTFIQQVSPLACPTFGSVKASVKTFFVPNRIIWENWQKFITGGSDGTLTLTPPQISMGILSRMSRLERVDSSEASSPYMVRGSFSSLISNLGLGDLVKYGQEILKDYPLAWRGQSGLRLVVPESAFTDQYVSTLPARAYQRIWWDYYRDSKLINDNSVSSYLNKGDNVKQNIITYPSDVTSNSVTYNNSPATWNTSVREWLTRYACYDKDYFTTASLNPQVGTSPSYVTAPDMFVANTDSYSRHATSSSLSSSYGLASNGAPSTTVGAVIYGNNQTIESSGIVPATVLSSHFTVEQLRQASAMQKYLETKNIAGGRYIQQLFAQFGIKAAADRLDMAEFLGGNDFDINFSTVTSSVGTDSDPLGTKGATMTGFGKNGIEYTASEHGILMSIMCIMPEVQYSQGIDPMFTRRGTKEDYFQPEFEQTGFEAIRDGELYMYDFGCNSNASPNDVFGYTPRYANMKWKRSVQGGDFDRYSTNGAGLLDAYNTNRLFRATPSLNANFIEMQTGSLDDTTTEQTFNRIFANTSGFIDHFLVNVYNDCQMVRPMLPLAAPSVPCDDEHGKTLRVPFGGIRVN